MLKVFFGDSVFPVDWCVLVFIYPAETFMYTWALTVTSVQVCTASSGINETAANSLCIPSARLEPFCISCVFLPSPPDPAGPVDPSSLPVRPPSPPPPSLQRKQMQTSSSPLVRVSGTHRRSPPTRKVPQRQLSWFPVTSESVFSHSDPVKESAEMNWWRTGLFIPRSPDLSLPHRPGILNWQQHILKCVIALEAADTQGYLLFIFNLPWWTQGGLLLLYVPQTPSWWFDSFWGHLC